ncbi:MAG: hypothetical protein JNK37_03830 [Verrucomicrobiales bacterium]|nr:hypothetical protein [Verrucomicrobiales bacterium]
MKTLTRSALAVALLSLPAVCVAAEEIDCRPVVDQLRKNVESAPGHVLTLLEDAVIANGGHCVGSLVKTAIEASKADADTVKKIVYVAVTNAPKQAPEIAESAVSASPKYADSVRAAFADAFDEKTPRLKPADPASKPAWEVANSPVQAPAPIPAPAPAPTPKPKPAPAPATDPQIAAAAAGDNPYLNIDGQNDDGPWELLHDGVVDKPSDLATAGAPDAGEKIIPPPPLEEEKATKKGFFSRGLPVLALPSLPEVDQPIDLYFSSPFGGIPAPNQDS